MRNSIIYIILFLIFANNSLSCPECNKEGGASQASFSLKVSESLYEISLGSAGSEAASLLAMEGDEDITALSDVGSLMLKESRGLGRIKRRNLYKKSIEGTTGFEVGDYVDLPARKVEVAALKSKTANARGYVLKVYSHLEAGKFENNHLSFEIEVIGGYKSNLSDMGFISESDVKNGDVYIVEAKKISSDGTIKGVNKVYRYFEEAAKPLDNWWYYEKNGVKSKAQKILQKQNDGSVLITKRIHRKNAIDETSEIKIKEAVKESERVLKNGRIRRGENTPEISTPYTSKTASTLNTTLDALGNKFKTKSESNAYYLSESAEHQKGKVRTKTNKDGTITLYEYHPKFEGNFRTYTTQKDFKLKDVSGDGVIGIEDLQNTPVIVEEKESIDWQGSRHSKRLVNKKAKVSFNAETEDAYKVVLIDEKVVSKKEYEHKRTENGGVIEEISTYKIDSNGELLLASVIAAEYETLAMSEAIAQYSLSNLSEEQIGKTIYVSDAGSLGFTASGFLSGTVPNYANAPRFDSTANTYYSNFRLTGVESETSSTISLPWGGTYTANGFALVSGKSTLEVELTLDYSGKTLYEATYVYIDGAFYLGEWTYYNYDMSTYDLRGTYKHNNTYSTQTALDSNNIRTFTDFNGSEYQIGYADSTESVEIFRRDIGASSTEYGTFTDKITVYAKDVSESGSCGCGEATGELGKKAVSVFSSPQIGGSGTANPNTDELVYQTYEYALNKNVKTLEVDKYGVATRREYIENNDNTYTVKTITSGFTSDNPYSTEIFDADTNELISKTGLGVVSEYRTKNENITNVIYGSSTSGRYAEYEYDNDKNLIRETTPLGTTTYTYNEYGLMTSVIYPNGVCENSTYDAFGNLISKTKTNDNEVISIPESYSIHYELIDNILWKIMQVDSAERNYIQKTRLSSFSTLTEENHPVLKYSEMEWNGKKEISIVYLDRGSKKYIIKEKLYNISSTSTELLSETKHISYNGNAVEQIESINSNDKTVKFQYNNYGDLIEKRYFTNEEPNYSVKYFYENLSQITILDEEGEEKLFKIAGRLLSRTFIKDTEKLGDIFQYIPRNEKNAGSLKSVSKATSFDSNNKPISGLSTYYNYNDMGKIAKIWGVDEIPSLFAYNDFGELTDMYLFKDTPSNASFFANETWPSSYTTTHPSVEHTIWNINSSTGLLISKIDASNKTISGIYSTTGDLLTLTDPNGNIINYTYSPNGKIATEQISGNSTSLISYSYNEDGNLLSVQSSLGSSVLTYDTNNKNMPATETMQDDYKLYRSFDSNGNVTNVILKDGQDNEVYSIGYSYDSSNLMSLNALGKSITYTYNSNGGISEINLNNISKIKYIYDNLSRIKSMAYMQGNNELRKNTYNYSVDGNIISNFMRKNNSDYANWQYEYFTNQQGLKKATLYKGAAQTNFFDAYSQENFEYDLAGNPYRAKVNSSNYWTNYTSNIINQTTQIDYASDLVSPIRGKTTSNAILNVKLDGNIFSSTSRDNEDFLVPIPAYNLQRKYSDISIESVLSDGGTNGTDAKTMQIGSLYISQTPEQLSYDNNGNLTSDSRWNYTWDYKNQLISVETSSDAVSTGVPREKYIYSYDYKGRKVKSEHYNYADSAWVLISINKRFYDNWNLIYETTEYTDSSIPTDVKKYYYGVDSFNTIYFSGGMGSLCMVDFNNEVGFVFSGANTNVESIFSADANCEVLADYLYSAYGEVMMKSGELAQKNPMRFSTRYAENTSLYYYGFRHYSPKLRKWTSNEPLGESESRNLNTFCKNNPINFIDKNGNAVMVVPWIAGELLKEAIVPFVAIAISGILLKNPPVDRPRECKPCDPIVGTMWYQVHRDHSHGGFCPHTHYKTVNQSPYPLCKCFVNGAEFAPGDAPLGRSDYDAASVSGGGPLF